MSKLGCVCGNVISDSHYPCETEGRILRQQHDSILDEVGSLVDSFFQAIKANTRNEWITSHFPGPYPLLLPDSDVVSDIISSAIRAPLLTVAECSSCGRLWVQQNPGENRYTSFAPDEPGYHALLDSRSNATD